MVADILLAFLTFTQKESARQKEARKREVKGDSHAASLLLLNGAYVVDSHAPGSGGLR